VDLLLGDPAKAQAVLGWNPQATSLEKLVQEMGESGAGGGVGWLQPHQLQCRCNQHAWRDLPTRCLRSPVITLDLYLRILMIVLLHLLTAVDADVEMAQNPRAYLKY
jgi:hypothetical protein